MTTPELREPRVAEFFAGIGLVGQALEGAGFDIVFANDVDAAKKESSSSTSPSPSTCCGISGTSERTMFPILTWPPLPSHVRTCHWQGIEWASPEPSRACSGSSLASSRRWGIDARSCCSSRTSSGSRPHMAGRTSLLLSRASTSLGYSCDVLVVDARRFVPQSRPRLFIVASLDRDWPSHAHLAPCWARPQWVVDLLQKHRQLVFHAASLPVPEELKPALGDILEDVPPADACWWNIDRVAAFVSSLSGLQLSRLEQRVRADSISAKTAYRRTRQGKATWEMRQDDLAGCLRTTRGGSSKQALVVAGQGMMRVRWMTPLEYARLQGAGGFRLDGIRENRAYFAFGDAVCVPVVAWLGEHYLLPLVQGRVADLKGFVDGLEADGQCPVSASAAAR